MTPRGHGWAAGLDHGWRGAGVAGEVMSLIDQLPGQEAVLEAWCSSRAEAAADPSQISWRRKDPAAERSIGHDPTGGGIEVLPREVAHWRGHDLERQRRREAGAGGWWIVIRRKGRFVARLDAPTYEPCCLHLTEADPFWHQPHRVLSDKDRQEWQKVALAIDEAASHPDPSTWSYPKGVSRLAKRCREPGVRTGELEWEREYIRDWPRAFCGNRWRDLAVHPDGRNEVHYGTLGSDEPMLRVDT